MSSEYQKEDSRWSRSAEPVHYAQTLTRQYLQSERNVYGVMRRREQNRDLRWNKILELPHAINDNN